VLDALGVTEQRLSQLIETAKDRSVTLRLSAEESCKFVKTTVREVESATSHVTTWSGGGSRKDVLVTKVTEHFWNFTGKYELTAFKGTGEQLTLSLQKRTVCQVGV
jgi:hypothetical protein